MIPDRTRVWAQRHLPAEIVSVRPVSGGRTDSVHAIDLVDGTRRTLRFLGVDAWGPTGARHVSAEAIGWRLAAQAAIPAPELIAIDPTARQAGGFASLSTWLPGRVRLDALSGDEIAALAELAVTIHGIEVDPDPAARPRPYESWAPLQPEIPAWAKDRASWRAALKVHAQPVPPTARGIIHRDLHVGNILWDGGQVSGVIDWAETSWGPAEVDVTHVRTNLAILQDIESATTFSAAYEQAGGLLDPEVQRYWAVADVLGFLPDPAPILNRLIRSRTDLDADDVRRRLETWLAHTLDG